MHELTFWLDIMKEHSLFIKLGLPCNQVSLVREAKQFYCVFEDLERRAKAVDCEYTFKTFINDSINAVKHIFILKRHLLHLYSECKLTGTTNSPLLMDHFSREAMYFLKVLEKTANDEIKYPINSILTDNVFWLRIMGDHAKFARSTFDQAERDLFNQAEEFSNEFDQLQLRARDFDSMLWHYKPNNDFCRFESYITKAVINIRDFNAYCAELVANCATVAAVPALVQDHQRREAAHFLNILEMVQEDLGSIDKLVIPRQT